MIDENYEFYLRENFDKYVGEWIAISGNEVIAHGKDAELVAQTAREHTKRDIRSVAVTWGYGARSQIEAAKPDYIVNNVAELERVLKAA